VTVPRYYRSLIFLLGLTIAACTPVNNGKVITPTHILREIEWTPEELVQDVAHRILNKTQEASFHLIRLKGAEEPHIHETHDLTVFVVSGYGYVHFKDRSEKIKVGDVIYIPRGVIHWGENLSPNGTEVYVVFTPPFDGTDVKVVEEDQAENRSQK